MPEGTAARSSPSHWSYMSAEYWVGQGGLEQAWQLLQTMQELQVSIAPHIPATTVESVCKVRASLCMASSGSHGSHCWLKVAL